MSEDVRKEISELREMISDYIAFLKQFTKKTLEVLRTIDRRLAALEAQMVRGSLKIERSATVPISPKPVVKPKPEPIVEPKIEPPPQPAAKPQPVAKPVEKKPVIKPPAPSLKPKKKKQEEVAGLSMKEVSESLMELLDV